MNDTLIVETGYILIINPDTTWETEIRYRCKDTKHWMTYEEWFDILRTLRHCFPNIKIEYKNINDAEKLYYELNNMKKLKK